MADAATATPDPHHEAFCTSRRSGELRLGVAGRGALRWAAVDLGAPLEEIRGQLDLSPVAAVALGRALSAAALLLRFSTKATGKLLLQVMGDGPLGKIVAEVDGRGFLRGLVGEPHLDMPDRVDGQGIEIGWAVGQGLMKVTWMNPKGKLYESQVELVSGEIGKDLVHFLEQSQQIRSAALLGVLPKPSGIAQAGGILIEALPGVEEDALRRLETNIAELGGVSAHLDRGGLEGLLAALLFGLDVDPLERHELHYGCGQARQELLGKMQALALEDVEAIVDESGRFAAHCAFCGRVYSFSRDELLDGEQRPVH